MKPQPFDPGLTQQFSGRLTRTINADGSFNVRRHSTRWRDANLFLQLINMSWPKFLALVVAAYMVVNLIFAGIYFAIGADQIQGASSASTLDSFWQVFFFSAQTLTTVGYGHLAPKGIATSAVASIEAMTGLLGFALATGLLYGRFSRPTAKIAFSDRMVVAPYQEITALQFRMANRRPNVLMELEAQVMLMTVDEENGR
ncbi:MAG: ion channel [Bryobacteraceae bacterium]